MNPLKGAARLHKQQFDKYVQSTGTRIVIRQPAKVANTSNPVSRAIGVASTATGPIGQIDEIEGIWNYGYTAGTSPFANPDQIPPNIRSIGTVENVDAVIRCRLYDVLIDKTNPGGRTLFDTCKDVLYMGSSFRVLAKDRVGLPPEGPYIYWVALKSNGPDA